MYVGKINWYILEIKMFNFVNNFIFYVVKDVKV